MADEDSIADMAPWFRGRIYDKLGLEISDLLHLQRWTQAIATRPAVPL